MDVTLNNVLEGARQYFMGIPTPVPNDSSRQAVWPAGTSPLVEGAPAQSGAPTPCSRPPSTAAEVPPSTKVLPRPPSEPLEPEPHIIHKATVMREALEKRQNQPNHDDDDPRDPLSPPTHIIHKPSDEVPSQAPAPAASNISPACTPLLASEVVSNDVTERAQLRPQTQTLQTLNPRPPDPYITRRSTDPYSASRPPEMYHRYHYEPALPDVVKPSRGPTNTSPQPSVLPRHSPQQTYARLSSAAIPYATERLRETPPHCNPNRYHQGPLPTTNDRVPPIHHPNIIPQTNHSTSQSHLAQSYQFSREASCYNRMSVHYDRHLPIVGRKHDAKKGFPGYRPSTVSSQHTASVRMETQHVKYKQLTNEPSGTHYTPLMQKRTQAPVPLQHDSVKTGHVGRSEYPQMTRGTEKAAYQFASPSVSSRFHQSAPMHVTQTNATARNTHLTSPAAAPKPTYEYATINQVPNSPARPSIKSGLANQQARMTVSVTSLVNQMNQTKHKRESPLDLSVKTVKNSADSSTTQDDAVDSATTIVEPAQTKSIPVHQRPSSSSHGSRQSLVASSQGSVAAHKVDFAPDFSSQYRDRIVSHAHSSGHYNGTYEKSLRPAPEQYSLEARQAYNDRNKYATNEPRNSYVPRIDLTEPTINNQFSDNRTRDNRHLVIDERKRLNGPISSNIPEKMMRYETWSADSRIEKIEKIDKCAKEQQELMSQPVYSYRSHKQFEAYQKQVASSSFNNPTHYVDNRYAYIVEPPVRLATDYHQQHLDRNYTNSRHTIHKVQNQRENIHYHSNSTMDIHSGVPADKRVLSILRNSLETKHLAEPIKQSKQMPDLIVIDDDVIEITDLTKETDSESSIKLGHSNSSHIPDHEKNTLTKTINSLEQHNNEKNKCMDVDVASRIRTKAELKVMPPSQENTIDREMDSEKPTPKSQKQHLFNQIREDSRRLQSVIKTENESIVFNHNAIKSEPMNIDEIEKDAEISNSENCFDSIDAIKDEPKSDLDWDLACDSFVEQLKSGCPKKKQKTRRIDSVVELVNVEIKKEVTSMLHETSTEFDSPLITDRKKSIEKEIEPVSIILPVVLKQEPIDEDDLPLHAESSLSLSVTNKICLNKKQLNSYIDSEPVNLKSKKIKVRKSQQKENVEKLKKDIKNKKAKVLVKEESESTDDDEPLIKSKLLKDKEQSEKFKFQLLKDLSEKSAYVKLECCDAEVSKSERNSIDSKPKKNIRQTSRTKLKGPGKVNIDKIKREVTSTDSDSDDLSVARRLRVRKNTNTKNDESASVGKITTPNKNNKSVLSKKQESQAFASTSYRRAGFGDGSDFHPGWEEELYRYKRSLRMPTRLIAIPRGRSGGPYPRASGILLSRGTTSLPDLDPTPLSPAPSSVPSAATDDLYTRRQDKLILDSDLDSNSSFSVTNKYDSEASISTINNQKKKGSIVDVLMEKYSKRDENNKKRGLKYKDDKTKNTKKPIEDIKCKKSDEFKNDLSMQDLYYFGNFKKNLSIPLEKSKETNDKLKTKRIAGKVKSRTRTDSRILKQRATIKEVFGDDRPASAPPSSCRENFDDDDDKIGQITNEVKERKEEHKQKLKNSKIHKDKMRRKSSTIRDGLRSTKSLKRNDAKGRFLRLKKRNNLIKNLNLKRNKEHLNKIKKDKNVTGSEKEKTDHDKDETPLAIISNKRKLKRLFNRRKFSSGFDYIRKKKKIIRRDDTMPKIIRKPAVKPNLESVHDIHKEIKSWIINKSIGETPLHRAARLGYTDCVVYCLEKMEADPSAKDNAGFTPLHVASAKGHVSIGRLLLQYGANVSAAAQGGIRPLHEAAENNHIEMIRLLLSYGADPILGTYSGQTPLELAEDEAADLLRLHIADVQGHGVEPWRFPLITDIKETDELGCDPLASPPESPAPPPEATMEVQCTEAPLPPFYSLRAIEGLWCLLQDITTLLQIKSKDTLLKQIHCGSGSPKDLFREIKTQDFLERAQCHQLLCAGEKINVMASKVALVRVTDKLRQLLKVETVLIS